ncbi:unnamed protein product, partial [Effrenium voratum]
SGPRAGGAAGERHGGRGAKALARVDPRSPGRVAEANEELLPAGRGGHSEEHRGLSHGLPLRGAPVRGSAGLRLRGARAPGRHLPAQGLSRTPAPAGGLPGGGQAQPSARACGAGAAGAHYAVGEGGLVPAGALERLQERRRLLLGPLRLQVSPLSHGAQEVQASGGQPQ